VLPSRTRLAQQAGQSNPSPSHVPDPKPGAHRSSGARRRCWTRDSNQRQATGRLSPPFSRRTRTVDN